MKARQVLLFLLATCLPVAGQTGADQLTEHTSDTLQIPPVALFPLWTPPGVSNATIQLDSLPPLPSFQPKTGLFLRKQRWLGMGMAVVCTVLSYNYHRQAEATYEEYRTSGDPAELDRLFRQTQRLDRLAGWSFFGIEAGLLMVTFSVVLAP
jgi:hypothetical protein